MTVQVENLFCDVWILQNSLNRSVMRINVYAPTVGTVDQQNANPNTRSSPELNLKNKNKMKFCGHRTQDVQNWKDRNTTRRNTSCLGGNLVVQHLKNPEVRNARGTALRTNGAAGASTHLRPCVASSKAGEDAALHGAILANIGVKEPPASNVVALIGWGYELEIPVRPFDVLSALIIAVEVYTIGTHSRRG